MASYTGHCTVSVDGKGRIAVPAKIRTMALGQGAEKFVLNRGMDGCVELYSDVDWKLVEERMATQHPISLADSRFFRRVFYSNVAFATTDSQGRILIPEFLLTHAGIEKEVLIMGAGDKAELWNAQRYKEYFEGFGETPEQVAERLFRKLE